MPSVAERIERPPPRPPTPTIAPSLAATASRNQLTQVLGTTEFGETPRESEYSEWELQEEQTRAIILLQRLLRGRAIQNMMYEVSHTRLLVQIDCA